MLIHIKSDRYVYGSRSSIYSINGQMCWHGTVRTQTKNKLLNGKTVSLKLWKSSRFYEKINGKCQKKDGTFYTTRLADKLGATTIVKRITLGIFKHSSLRMNIFYHFLIKLTLQR